MSQCSSCNLSPGKHTIYSKAENWAETQVTAKAGDIIFIEEGPTMGIFKGRNNILKLEDYVEKYHVKTLKVGVIMKTGK